MTLIATGGRPPAPLGEPSFENQPATSAGTDGIVRRFVRGRPADPAWVRPTLLALLVGTAALYIIGLGASGWANSFYAAAVQAGTKSWKAFFFGSSDASNFITVDKPPASLWVMELSARVFGVNSWSLLVPQALEGVASVGLLYVTVRRWATPAAGLLAGLVLALTPVAVLMFRFNNPDALLVLLTIVAAYATVRAIEGGSSRWVVLAGAALGLGFLTKELQALILAPVLGGVYLLCADTRLRRRLVQLAVGGVSLLVAAGWWVAIVQLTPAADRPYIGGSTDNNLLNLIFGYNGFGRLSGNETGSVGGGAVAGSRWGPTGLLRMFNSEFGSQISWLIPAALLLAVAVLWIGRRTRRTDRIRAMVLLFGGWLLLTGLVFSLASGIIHPYYSVALAPAIGGLVGIGATVLFARRATLFARLAMAVTLMVTAVWAYVLLDRSPTWYPALKWAIVVLGALTAVGLVFLMRRGRWWATGLGAAAIVVGLAAPAAYALDTASSPESGAIPSAGPAVAGGGGPGGFAGFGGGARLGIGRFGGGTPTGGPPAGFTPPAGGFGGTGRAGGFGGGGRPGGFGGGGAAGGLLNAGTPSAATTDALQAGASKYKWVAAAVGSNSAAGYQLASGDPVMAIGGFNGTDPTPTLAQFKALVAQGTIHYFIASGGGFGGGGFGGGASATSSDSSQITSWVEATFTAHTVGGTTLYDLSTGATGG